MGQTHQKNKQAKPTKKTNKPTAQAKQRAIKRVHARKKKRKRTHSLGQAKNTNQTRNPTERKERTAWNQIPDQAYQASYLRIQKFSTCWAWSILKGCSGRFKQSVSGGKCSHGIMKMLEEEEKKN